MNADIERSDNRTAVNSRRSPSHGATARRPDAGTAIVTTPFARSRTEMRAEEPPCVWPLPHRSESAGTARRVTRAALAEWGMDKDTTEEIVLVVSELVTNAVEHALPPVALHLERSTEGTVHVKVDDGGPAAQEGAWATTGGQEEHGRGGGIVALLATAHGTHSLPAGTAYWADLPVAV